MSSQREKPNFVDGEVPAREVYDIIRRKQIAQKREAKKKKTSAGRKPIKIQYLGFRKRLLVFALSMIVLCGYYMISFVLGLPGGPEFGHAMDAITLGVINVFAFLLPNGEVIMAPVRNVISFTPLGVVLGICIIALLITLGVSFAYAVIVTAREQDKHDSNFMMG